MPLKPSEMAQKMSRLRERLEKSCLVLGSIRQEHIEAQERVDDKVQEEAQLKQRLKGRATEHTDQSLNEENKETDQNPRVKQIKDEIISLTQEKSQVDVQVMVLNSQVEKLEDFLLTLRDKIQDRMIALKDFQEDNKIAMVQMELEEILALNVSKVKEEYALLKEVLGVADVKNQEIDEDNSLLMDKISKCQVDLAAMREEVIKGKIEEDLRAIETSIIWENIEDQFEDDAGDSAIAAPSSQVEEKKNDFKIKISEKSRELERVQRLVDEANKAVVSLQTVTINYDVAEDDMEIERLKRKIEELEMKEIEKDSSLEDQKTTETVTQTQNEGVQGDLGARTPPSDDSESKE